MCVCVVVVFAIILARHRRASGSPKGTGRKASLKVSLPPSIAFLVPLCQVRDSSARSNQISEHQWPLEMSGWDSAANACYSAWHGS